MTAFDKAWDVVKDANPTDKAWDSVIDDDSFKDENLKRGEPCYACLSEASGAQHYGTDMPPPCPGATWSYHGGAGGLFTYCDPQMKRVVQETKDDPSLEPGDPEYGSWTDDLREM